MLSLNQYPLHFGLHINEIQIIDDLVNYFMYFLIIILLLIVIFLSYTVMQSFFNSPLRQLKKAIKDDQLEPWIQPVFDSKSKLTGGEILVRWNHPTRGLIFPLDYIKLAKKCSNSCSKQKSNGWSNYFFLTGDILPKEF